MSEVASGVDAVHERDLESVATLAKSSGEDSEDGNGSEPDMTVPPALDPVSEMVRSVDELTEQVHAHHARAEAGAHDRAMVAGLDLPQLQVAARPADD